MMENKERRLLQIPAPLHPPATNLLFGWGRFLETFIYYKISSFPLFLEVSQQVQLTLKENNLLHLENEKAQVGILIFFMRTSQISFGSQVECC